MSVGSAMFAITEAVTINRSPEDVFAYFSDGRHRPEWDTTVVSEELTSPPPVGVGSTIRTRMSVLSRRMDFEWRVSRFDPPLRMATDSIEGPMPTSVEFAFTAVEGGCRVRAAIEGHPAGMMRLAEPLIAESVRSTLAAALERARLLLGTTHPSRQ